jgi:hypothetical protein
MNSTPADSKASRTAKPFAVVIEVSSSASSARRKVATLDMKAVCNACGFSSIQLCALFSDYLSAGISSFASCSLTWLCGNFCLSSKPALNAPIKVLYSDSYFPSTSTIYFSHGRLMVGILVFIRHLSCRLREYRKQQEARLTWKLALFDVSRLEKTLIRKGITFNIERKFT